MSRVVYVTTRIKAVQFIVDVKPWPARVHETWASPPECNYLNESTLHRMRRAQADQEVMNLHRDGFSFYWWDDVQSRGYGLKSGYWIIPEGVHRGVYDHTSFHRHFSEVPVKHKKPPERAASKTKRRR
jgi:hypothetical protein